MSDKIIPIKIDRINENIYSGFLARLGANLLDGVIVIPVAVLLFFVNSLDKNIFFFTIIPDLLFVLWYNVFLPKRYGGTPGKLIVGIKIIRIDSLPIGWKESFLRYSVNIFFVLVNLVVMIIAILLADDEMYNSLTWFQKPTYLNSLIAHYDIITILSNIWVWSEVIILLTNKRKRAMHDFIAGTVIIKSEYVEKVRETMQ
jgi:uncharacterized RDD family membrane protein YckC